jgi:hypothetical protein
MVNLGRGRDKKHKFAVSATRVTNVDSSCQQRRIQVKKNKFKLVTNPKEKHN